MLVGQPGSVPPTQRPAVYEQLRSWILSGALPPGQRLQVRELARGFGVSTMPIREALVRLEALGLVTQERNKGAVVSQLSLESLNDFYNLRQIIEPRSIQMGIERMTPNRLTRLDQTMASLKAAVEADELTTVLDLDEDMLMNIHSAVNNRELNRVIKLMWIRVRPYKMLFTTTAQADAGHYIAAENAQLLALTTAGDGDGARELMHNSLANAQVLLSDLLREHQEDGIEADLSKSIAGGETLATAITSLIHQRQP